METILRSQEMAEIKLLPVRHHSPACAWQVQRTIEEWKPQAVLIEGPDTACSLISAMIDPATKAPFAVYYSYDDTAGVVSEDKEKYRCYYPFLDYSPELAALRTGSAQGAQVAFIDLPYGDILAASQEGKGMRQEAGKSNYNDDYLLSRNDYLQRLCEKTGLRSFDEFWEKYFELEGLKQDGETWFGNLLTYCRQARESTPPEQLREEGCLAREAYMAGKILEKARELAGGSQTGQKAIASQRGKKAELSQAGQGAEASQAPHPEEGSPALWNRILVVTGGFHTPALAQRLGGLGTEMTTGGSSVGTQPEKADDGGSASNHRDKESSSDSALTDLPKKLVSAKDQGVYLMPYSMEAADALNGYASGMPFPGFYQEIWEHVQGADQDVSKEKSGTVKQETVKRSKAAKKQADQTDSSKTTDLDQPVQEELTYMSLPYARAVLDMIVATGKAVRRAEGSASTYDEICACSMVEGLAALRGKPQPGAYELQDAVLSCFVKGEYNLATDEPMRLLRRQMTGKRVGELCPGAGEPPVLQDFRAQCKRYGLQTSSTLETEVTLSIFSKAKHRQMSMFFHRLLFMQAPYARRVKGPNLQTGRDRNLMREIWKYKWSAQVMAALIDASVYGGTVEDAAKGLVQEQLKKAVYAREGAQLLTQVLEMGLEGQLEQVYCRLQELLMSDTDFYSLAEALRSLTMVQQLRCLYDSGLETQGMILTCVRRLLGLLPGMARVKEEDMSRCMEAMKLLYQVIGRMDREESREPSDTLLGSYFEALLAMDQDSEIQAGVHGCIHGLLYGGGREDVTRIEQVCRGYLTGTREQLLKTAMFFRGLFYGAKDLVFVGDTFLRMLDEFLMQVGEEDFMQLLPELHMAFTYFTPAETDRIAQAAAGFHGKSRRQLLEQEAVPEAWYLYGQELEKFVLRALSS